MHPFLAPYYYKYRDLAPRAELQFWMDLDWCIAHRAPHTRDHGR